MLDWILWKYRLRLNKIAAWYVRQAGGAFYDEDNGGYVVHMKVWDYAQFRRRERDLRAAQSAGRAERKAIGLPL